MVCITDRDAVIAAAGGARKDYMGKAVSQELEDAIQERENIQASAGERKYVRLIDEDLEDCFAETICPIICEGDAIGAVALFSRDPKAKMSETEQKLALAAANFLGRQMEQ